MDQQKTAEYLKQLRKGKGLTQEQLAEILCVSSRTVSRWETGRSMPPVDMLILLADFYGVDIQELLDGEQAGADRKTKDILKTVAAYAVSEERKTQSKTVYFALGIVIAVLLCTKLFAGETTGLLYGIVPESICNGIMLLVYGISIAAFVAYLRSHWFQEKPSTAPVHTVAATVISKEIKPGTHRAGRSKGGYSYTVRFLTEDGQSLELYAYEIEFGGLKEGMQGLLTFQGSYFIRFQNAT